MIRTFKDVRKLPWSNRARYVDARDVAAGIHRATRYVGPPAAPLWEASATWPAEEGTAPVVLGLGVDLEDLKPLSWPSGE